MNEQTCSEHTLQHCVVTKRPETTPGLTCVTSVGKKIILEIKHLFINHAGLNQTNGFTGAPHTFKH